VPALATVLTAVIALAAAPAPAAMAQDPSPAAAAVDTSGFLYGEAVTRSGNTYRGRLRWDDEESFWGDYFNSTKKERPYAEKAPDHMRERRERVTIFGISIGTRWDDDDDRRFVAPFGALREIEVHRGDEVTVTMKSGTRYELEGGSNDIGADVVVWDEKVGRIALEWDELERVRFLPAPADLAVDVHRLHGTVESDAGTFRGWIQWDQDECLSSDELDGDTRDGDVSIPMGRIRRIERASRRASLVTMDDGRELRLDGSNDVDDDNRGIYVEDDRFGRVLVSWDAFESVTFDRPAGSGPAQNAFAAGGPLVGTVTDRQGRKHAGRIAFDLDETETWELLSGTRRDVEFIIPFALVAAVVPDGDDSAKVFLESGLELRLEGGADVGEGNSGVAVIGDDGDVRYVEWEDVRRIDFR
jgi:hypothetical protein